MAYVPNRSDIVWLSFTPQAGHEQTGRRPALVLSPKAYNLRIGLATVSYTHLTLPTNREV